MKTAPIIVSVLALVIALALFVAPKDVTRLGSKDGLQATVATSSFRAATATTVQLLFATSSACTSRIISNQAGALKLTFNDKLGARPTAVNGVLQSASTTVVYDAEQYGCGAVYVYPYGTDTLTLVETL